MGQAQETQFIGVRGHSPGTGCDENALNKIQVKPVSMALAKQVLVRHHYLHTFPGATTLSFGVFAGTLLNGALTLGAGPAQAHRLVEGASRNHCLALTRFWLSEELPKLSESKVLGIVLKALRRYTSLKFIITYADPSAGHVGTIYQATNWLYTGLSESTPLYQLGDSRPYHSRSFSSTYGTRSSRYFRTLGLDIKVVAQAAKHRYIYFLVSDWRQRLAVPAQPYPKKENLYAAS